MKEGISQHYEHLDAEKVKEYVHEKGDAVKAYAHETGEKLN